MSNRNQQYQNNNIKDSYKNQYDQYQGYPNTEPITQSLKK